MTDKATPAPPMEGGGSENKAQRIAAETSTKDEIGTGSLCFKTPEDVADALRRRCKRAFFKHVSKTGAMEVIEAARAQGFDPKDFINIGNENNKTALMFASQLKNAHDLVRFLLSHGADPNASTHRGHTAVVFASGKGREETLRVLFEYGGRVRVRVVRGDTTVSIASPRLSPAMRAELRWREETEEKGWLDFTDDARAQEAQRLHEQTCKHCRVRLGLDPPPPSWRKRRQRAQQDLFAPLALEDLSTAISSAFEEAERSRRRGAREAMHPEEQGQKEEREGGEKRNKEEQEEADDDDDDDDDDDEDEEEEIGDKQGDGNDDNGERKQEASATEWQGARKDDEGQEQETRSAQRQQHDRTRVSDGGGGGGDGDEEEHDSAMVNTRSSNGKCNVTSTSSKSTDSNDNDNDNDNGNDNGDDNDNDDETIVQRVRVLVCRCVLTSFSMPPEDRKAFAPAFSSTMAGIITRLTDKQLIVLLRACDQQAIISTIKTRSDFPVKRAPFTFTHVRKALAHVLQQPETRSRLRPRMLARISDGTIACMLLSSLVDTCGSTWTLHPPCERAASDVAAPPPSAIRPTAPATDASCTCAQELSTNSTEDGDSSWSGTRICAIVAVVRTHLSSLIRVRNLAEVRDSLDCLQALAAQTENRRESPVDSERSEQPSGACTAQWLVLRLLTWAMCGMAREGHLPFVETQLKRVQRLEDRKDVLHAVLQEILPPVDAVLASMETSTGTSDSSNDTTETTHASEGRAQGASLSQKPAPQPTHAPPNTSQPSVPQQQQQQQQQRQRQQQQQQQQRRPEELRCQYSIAAIERVLLSCGVTAPAWATERMELLCLQEIVSQQRLFDAVEYASTSATLRQYLIKCGVTAERAEEEYAQIIESISKTCLQLPDSVRLTWVDTPQGLDRLLESLQEHVLEARAKREEVLVGIDTEWRQPRPECTVMQLAVTDHAWVVDTLAPSFSQTYRDTLSRLLEFLFTVREVHVLGFSFKDDVRHMIPLCPSLASETRLAFTDVQALVRRRLKKKAQPSLSRCCELVFGRPLNKIEQCSNWERRPLRDDQLSYAAIDAWSLIGVYRHYASQ